MMLGLGGIAFELLPQRADGDAEIVDLLLLRRAPDGAQQMGVGQHAAGMLGELGEHGIFLGRQMDLARRRGARRAGTGRS